MSSSEPLVGSLTNGEQRPPRARVVLNPRAGNAEDVRAIGAAIDVWRARGWEVELTPTQYAGHGIELAREAVRDGFDVVTAAGGDGTVNEVINGLLGAGADPPNLGVVPVGSGNDFAWSAGLPLDPAVACQRLFDGRTRRIDVGHVREAGGRERYFCNGCGAGFDAQAALEIERLKWLRGFLIYLVAVLKTLVFHHQVPLLRIDVDGREWSQHSMMLTVGNGLAAEDK